MIKINLLPIRAAQKRELIRFQLTVAGLVTGFILTLFVIFFLIQATELKSVENEIDNLNTELATVKKKIGELNDIKKQKKMIEDKLNIVKELEAKRSGPVAMFAVIEKTVPSKAWIKSFKETRDGITLVGFAASEEVAGDFVRSLQNTGKFANVELPTVNATKQASYQVYQFTINITRLAQ